MPQSVIEKHFRSDLASVMYEYSLRLQFLLDECDAVVFVARRAMLLYQALLVCGFVKQNQHCRVLSSRALSFAGLDFSGQTVLIVDDVIVKGEAMERACAYVYETAESCVGLVAVSCSKDAEATVANMDVRLQVLRHLAESDVYELTREINNFAQSVGLTNNIDQPEFRLSLPKDCGLRDVLRGHEWFDCSTEVQRSACILSATITYDGAALPYEMPEVLRSSNALLVKARFIGRVGVRDALMLPFVVLPSLDEKQISTVYEWLVAKGLDPDAANASVRCNEARSVLENKIRIIQYYLSWLLGNAVMQSLYVAETQVLEEREAMLFGSCKTSDQLRSELDAPSCRGAELPVCVVESFGRELLSKAVRAQYLKHDIYTGIHGSNDAVRLTVERLFREVATAFSEYDMRELHDGSAIPVATSVCLDYLIDCGVIVPVLKYDTDDDGVARLVRSYRSGEIERLSIREMELFSYVVRTCLEKVRRKTVRRSTVNRLAVLFAREVQRNRTAGIHDETSVLDFAYTSEGEFSETTDSNPYGSNFLADILVRKKLLAWAQRDKSTLKVEMAVQGLDAYELELEEKHAIEATAYHFAEYLNAAKGMDTDALLDVLIMQGSRRYVLGSVRYRLGLVWSALEALVHPAKCVPDSLALSAIEGSGGLKSLVIDLVERCDWALPGSPGSSRTKRLQDEFDEVVERIKKYQWSELSGFISDSSSMGASESLVNDCIEDVVRYGGQLQDLMRQENFWQQPTALRLIESGAVLKKKIDTLNQINASQDGLFSVFDSRVCIIACTSAPHNAAAIGKSYSFYAKADDLQQCFSLRESTEGNGEERFGFLAVAFECEGADPHEVMQAGEVRVREAMSTSDRFARIFSERMRGALVALFGECTDVGVRRVAVCHKKEDEGLWSGKEVIDRFRGRGDAGFYALGRVEVSENVRKSFGRCGLAVSMYNFGEG